MYSMACLSSNFVKVKDSRCLSTTTLSFSMLTGDWRWPPQLEWGRRCQWDGLKSEGRWEVHVGFFKHLHPVRANNRLICCHTTYHSDHHSTTRGLGNEAHLKCNLSCVSFLQPAMMTPIWYDTVGYCLTHWGVTVLQEKQRLDGYWAFVWADKHYWAVSLMETSGSKRKKTQQDPAKSFVNKSK